MAQDYDPYKILGIQGDDHEVENIERKYKKLEKATHADKAGYPEMITKVKASYELLKDPELRRLFDAKIKNSYTLEDAWNEINRLKTAKFDEQSKKEAGKEKERKEKAENDVHKLRKEARGRPQEDIKAQKEADTNQKQPKKQEELKTSKEAANKQKATKKQEDTKKKVARQREDEAKGKASQKDKDTKLKAKQKEADAKRKIGRQHQKYTEIKQAEMDRKKIRELLEVKIKDMQEVKAKLIAKEEIITHTTGLYQAAIEKAEKEEAKIKTEREEWKYLIKEMLEEQRKLKIEKKEIKQKKADIKKEKANLCKEQEELVKEKEQVGEEKAEAEKLIAKAKEAEIQATAMVTNANDTKAKADKAKQEAEKTIAEALKAKKEAEEEKQAAEEANREAEKAMNELRKAQAQQKKKDELNAPKKGSSRDIKWKPAEKKDKSRQVCNDEDKAKTKSQCKEGVKFKRKRCMRIESESESEEENELAVILRCSFDKCGRTFTSRSAFKRHANQHTDKYPCSICSKVFTRRDILKKHRDSMHIM